MSQVATVQDWDDATKLVCPKSRYSERLAGWVVKEETPCLDGLCGKGGCHNYGKRGWTEPKRLYLITQECADLRREE